MLVNLKEKNYLPPNFEEITEEQYVLARANENEFDTSIYRINQK